MNDKLRALPGFVLIEVLKDPTENAGFAMPESSQEKPQKGTVIHGNEFIEDGLVVVFKRYSGIELKEEGKDLRIVPEDDIMGVYETN